MRDSNLFSQNRDFRHGRNARCIETEKASKKKDQIAPAGGAGVGGAQSPDDQGSEDNLFQKYKENSKIILDCLAKEAAGQNTGTAPKNVRKSKNSTTRLSQSDLIFPDQDNDYKD